ncbi:hypothetical protein FMN50_14625 [Rhodobacterales bacterium]|nr:hypothetical protein FMN50_14625 [Rhodobacterales bacterium]
MADVAIDQSMPRQGLGIGSIFSQSFSILRKKFLIALVLSLPSGLVFALNTWLQARPFPGLASYGMLTLAGYVAGGISTSLIVQMAYDAKLYRPARIGHYVTPVLRGFPQIIILTTLAGVLTSVGAMIFVIPGLWVGAVFSLVVPAIVIEGAGFGALSRSARLTREYRWPIATLVLVIAVLEFGFRLLAAFFHAFFPDGTDWEVVSISLAVLIGAGSSAFGSIITSMLYARLREIKEGITVDRIAMVFD